MKRTILRLSLGALLLASAPSLCEVPTPCGTTLAGSLASLRDDVAPLRLIDFFDSLSGPGSGTLRELMSLAGIEHVRFARRPWVSQTRIKRSKLILPYPKLRAAFYEEDLARLYLSIFEILRVRALRASASPFKTDLATYQRRVAETLARSEFQAYDILFYLAPQFLKDEAPQNWREDLSLRDRRRLSQGRLPSFVSPSLDRVMNGWIDADPEDADAAIKALDDNVPRERLNYLWFGDTEHRLKRTFWRGIRYATIASGLFSLVQVGPELLLFWNARDQIYQAATETVTVPLTPADRAEGRRRLHDFYRRRILDTQKVLDAHPRSPNALADLDYYQQRARETE